MDFARPARSPPGRRSCAPRASPGGSRAPRAASLRRPGRAACGRARRASRPRRAASPSASALVRTPCPCSARSGRRARRRPAPRPRRAFGRRRQDEVGGGDRRHLDMEVDAVEQRPRDLGLIIGGAARRARAGERRIAEMAAAARVHRRDQLDPRRKVTWVGAGDADLPVSSGWRSESSTALEFGKLVEEQHAEMGEADLARPDLEAAADQRRHRGAVMRRAERARRGSAPPSSSPATEAIIDTSSARTASAAAGSGQAGGEQRLAGAGRPTISRLWPPAAAISSARLALSWPLTWARSGPKPGARPRRARRRQHAACP
jgi:hypothetical protein